MRVFITGAASPLGRAVVAALVRRGHRVVGLARRRTGLTQIRELGAEPVAGDVRKAGDWAEAMAGCEMVFHLANYFDFWSSEPDLFQKVNVDGTGHTILAAVAAGVRRVVVCSSALTLAEPGRDERSGDTSRTRPATAFERSARAAEQLALRLRARGIEVVLVHPSLVVAPADPGWTGRLIASRVRGRQQLTSRATVGWVWVQDAAEGVVRAGERGTDGAQYVISGELASSHTFLSKIAARAGTAPPRAISRSLALGEAALATALARPFGRRPRVAVDEMRFLATGFRVDGQEAADELEFEYTPAFRYMPGLVKSYRQAMERFAKR